MKAKLTNRQILIAILVTITLTAGLIVSVLVLATGNSRLTATAYSDVIRFEAEGVATLQVRLFDLSGKEVWDSGIVSGWTVDWDRNNDFGERLAYGAYIYSAQGWNAEGGLIFQKNGKLALMPGDQVQLQAAPAVTVPQTNDGLAPFRDEPFTFQPMAVNVDHSTESWAFGQVGIGTSSPVTALDVVGTIQLSGGEIAKNVPTGRIGLFSSPVPHHGASIAFWGETSSYPGDIYLNYGSINTSIPGRTFNIRSMSPGSGFRTVLRIDASGKVGIGTTTPTATLEVHGSATNLLALYDPVTPSDPKFRVTKTGEVRADGAYYGSSFNTGSADVAERINTSEWVEPGNVVEIDPEHPGFFRKSSSPYSTKVAGIISTSPGVILGNSFDEATDDWEDSRPVLAVTGRVPCKASAENGSIEIGDLLVASSIPGVAMKGDPEEAIGAVLGKAMEALKEGAGTIVVQVMLR